MIENVFMILLFVSTFCFILFGLLGALLVLIWEIISFKQWSLIFFILGLFCVFNLLMFSYYRDVSCNDFKDSCEYFKCKAEKYKVENFALFIEYSGNYRDCLYAEEVLQREVLNG